MNESFWSDVEAIGYTLYEVAVQDDSGISYRRMIPSNLCQDSYSIAKAYTMTAIGMLWDQGKLDLDAPILPILNPEGRYQAAPGWEKVTVHHCLKHIMGTDENILDIDVNDSGEFPIRDYLEYMLSRPLAHEPGYRRYTDGAYYLLSRVAGAKAGKTCDMLLANMLQEVMRCREVAWSRCPAGHPIGATGLYIAARDMVKLGWLYLNGGVYNGVRVVSREWTDLALQREYEFACLPNGWHGKGGMRGQMLMFNPERRISVAWHAYEPKGKEELVKYICSL